MEASANSNSDDEARDHRTIYRFLNRLLDAMPAELELVWRQQRGNGAVPVGGSDYMEPDSAVSDELDEDPPTL